MAQGRSQSASLGKFADHASHGAGRADDVYRAVTKLFEHQNQAFSMRERALAIDILKRVSKDVEMSIRIALAERMANDIRAPHELILLLADDRIEVARLVLLRSPILLDADLVHVIETGSADHHIAIAERPGIGETVSAALAKSAGETALVTLVRNPGAKIRPPTFERLAERSRELSRLQAPLIEHGDFPADLAVRMYVFVADALKTTLSQRYPNIAATLSQAVDKTASDLQTGNAVMSDASAEKLVAKLSTSGQLRSSFLIRVLNQGQMELFEHAFAALLRMDIEGIRNALYGENPMNVALACRAAGIDRSVFMTVFNLSRHHRGVTATLSENQQSEIQGIFCGVPKSDALERLKAAAA